MKKSIFPLTLGGLGIGTTEFVMMGILPDVANHFGVRIPEAGHAISLYALGVVIGAPLLVALSTKFAPKKILLALMIIFTLFNALSAFSGNYYVLLAARFFAGLPHGAFFGVGSVVATRLADGGKQAQAVSMMFLGLTVANLLMVPVGTYMGHHFSWRYTFGLVALIGIITIAFIHFWLPDVTLEKKPKMREEFNFFKTREAWLIVLLTSIGTGGLFAWISYIAPLMTNVSGFEADTVAYIMVLAGLGMVVGNILGGKLADAMAPVKACLVLMCAMALTLGAIYLLSENKMVSLLLTFIAGALSLSLAAPIQMLMIRTAKNAEMLGAAVTQASFNIGNSLGAFFGGLPIAIGLAYNTPSLVGVVMALVGAGICWYLMRYLQRR